MRRIVLSVLVAVAVASASGAEEDTLFAQARRLFAPLPKTMVSPDNPLTPEKVALGRRLFFETRVSADGTVSCARCHLPSLYGTDALAEPIGVRDRVNPRNAPTVLNAALQVAAHWRADRRSVEDQATQALVGPPSFGNASYEEAMARLRALPGYTAQFARAFPGQPEPVTADNWGKAIGAFERTLVTPTSFDAYLAGDHTALPRAAQAGLQEFIGLGCATCHNGAGVGGGMLQKFGLVEDYWKETGSPTPDKGRFDVTHDPGDLYVFKVPSLRNVAMTPPYFHDGSVATLPDAVRVMGKVQLGRTLTEPQVARLLAFLDSLTGRLPADFVRAPILPAAEFRKGGVPLR
jgi:cytochrome c peroxidase